MIPTVIRPVRQHEPYTCAVASLSAIIGRDYEDVYDYAHKRYRHLTCGLTNRQMQAIARHFKVNLKILRTFDVQHDTGILIVARRATSNHAVVLFNGSIYDPMDGQLWEPDVYLASHAPKYRARWGTLCVPEASA